MGLKKIKEVILSEKPSAAKKIAEAIGGKEVTKKKEGTVTYYVIEKPEKIIYVVPTVGHIYGLAEKEKSFSYPVFDIEWKPIFYIDKGHDYTKKYFNVLKKILKDADQVIVACDYDIEGELIGYNITRFMHDINKAKRMKFSTLTAQELKESYEKVMPTIDFGQAVAGETRHILDWFYGINLSRALMQSLRKNKLYRVLSIGRVQGPALKIVVDREKEIEAFKPKPFWVAKALLRKESSSLEFVYSQEKIWEEEKVKELKEKLKDAKEAEIISVVKKEEKVRPPAPFDLTTLQTQAYRWFKIKPNETLQIAQNLYLEGLISYPRTSSQKIDSKINVKAIVEKLKAMKEYEEDAKQILSQEKIKPANGKKSDPAHPAIYPTGILPKKLNPREKKIYDLIVRRFLACLGEDAIRESTEIKASIKGEIFNSRGLVYKKEGWRKIYGPYLEKNEKEIPLLEKGEILKVEKILFEKKETKPPARYSPASLVKELERRNLGTKATRANVVQTLYDRGYITGDPIVPTILGRSVVSTMEKYFPKIIDEELTRKFEEDMESIRQNISLKDKVIEDAKQVLQNILGKIKEKEKEVGESLSEAHKKTLEEERIIGQCPLCGGNVVIRESKRGKFLGCSNWPNCNFTVSLRNSKTVGKSGKKCEKCSWYMLEFRVGKRKRTICVNPNCEKATTLKERAESLKEENKGKICPKCGAKLVVREYLGEFFLGCSNWPNCDYIENIKKK